MKEAIASRARKMYGRAKVECKNINNNEWWNEEVM